MKGQITVRLPEETIERIETICLKEGNRSVNSFGAEAINKLVKEKENSKDEE